MSEVTTVRCDADGCEAVKAASNKWFKVVVSSSCAVIVKAAAWYSTRESEWFPTGMERQVGEALEVHDACGLPHAQKIVQEALSKP